MFYRIGLTIKEEWKALFELKKSERLWHIPMLASICVGLPLLLAWYFNHLEWGLTASLGGLVILYMPESAITQRLITLSVAAFGFILSYSIGTLLGFSSTLGPLGLMLFAFLVHWVTTYLQLKAPGNFFFIMMASIAVCAPFRLEEIPLKIGLLSLGTIIAFTLALFYTLIFARKNNKSQFSMILPTVPYARKRESLVMGLFIGGSIWIANLMELENPYWVPISCLAVMQGVSSRLIFRRSLHRILGTSMGMLIAYGLLLLKPGPLGFIVGILILQFIVEMLIVRHYALAVVFITPMTVFLAEAANPLVHHPLELLGIRFFDIVLGSAIGAVGGFIRYTILAKYRYLG